jgi:hypothetical protein
MKDLLKWIYDPPPTPPLDIPFALKVAKIPIEKGLELFYLAGWYDGFVFGLVVALLLLPRRGK